MLVSRWLVLDVAAAPILNAEDFIDAPEAPANWKDPVKIAAYREEKRLERLDSAALDMDLARITAIAGWSDEMSSPQITLCQNEQEERVALMLFASGLRAECGPLVTYNGSHYDLPLLQRRARYLGVEFPHVNVDRYRSPHLDLCRILSDNDPSRRRPLSFYVKRLQMTDLFDKPLDGPEEARVFETGRWDDLKASIARDVTATYRLARWLGVISPCAQEQTMELPL